MAQVCGDSSFDFVWSRQHDTALGVLRNAANLWATHGTHALSTDAVIAVLLRIYLSEWPRVGSIRRETRDLHSWLQLVGPAREEVRTLRPNASSEVAARTLCALNRELLGAINEWVMGDPESPPTTHALNVVEHILFIHKMTRRPGSPKKPSSIAGQAGTEK